MFLLKKLESVPYIIATTSLVLELFTTLFLSGLITALSIFLYFKKHLELGIESILLGTTFILLCFLLTFLIKKLKPKWLNKVLQAFRNINKKNLTIYKTNGHCWGTPTPCTGSLKSKINVKKKNGYYFLYK